jgi:hypothetical protein
VSLRPLACHRNVQGGLACKATRRLSHANRCSAGLPPAPIRCHRRRDPALIALDRRCSASLIVLPLGAIRRRGRPIEIIMILRSPLILSPSKRTETVACPRCVKCASRCAMNWDCNASSQRTCTFALAPDRRVKVSRPVGARTSRSTGQSSTVVALQLAGELTCAPGQHLATPRIRLVLARLATSAGKL